MKILLPKIRKYHVWLPGNKSYPATDNPNLAEKRAILGNGTVYEDIRYNGRKRLQRMYFVAASNGTLPKEIDYPDLITFSN
jgi:hypothetical protein